MTDAELAAASSLSFVPTPPQPAALRLVYSRTDVEDLVASIARTRRELCAALGVRAELLESMHATSAEVTRLREQEQRQVLALDRYINRLADL